MYDPKSNQTSLAVHVFSRIPVRAIVSKGGIASERKAHSFVIKLGESGYVLIANSLINIYGNAKDLILGK